MQFVLFIFIENTEYFYVFLILISCHSRIIIGIFSALQGKKTQSPKAME